MSLEITEELIARQSPEAQAIIRLLLAKIAELEARLNDLQRRQSHCLRMSTAAIGLAAGIRFFGCWAPTATPTVLSAGARDVLLRYPTRAAALQALEQSRQILADLPRGNSAYSRMQRSIEYFEAFINEAFP